MIDWLIVGTALVLLDFHKRLVKISSGVGRIQFISPNSETGHQSGEVAIAKVL